MSELSAVAYDFKVYDSFFQSHCRPIDKLMPLCILAFNHERAVAEDGTGSGTASSSNKTAYGPRFVARTQPCRWYDR